MKKIELVDNSSAGRSHMNWQYALIGLVSMACLYISNASANCSLPCGVQELLECAAARQPVPLANGEALYNTLLFKQGDATSPPMIDGLCQADPGQMDKTKLPAGALAFGLQQYYYYNNEGGFCKNSDPQNRYYSYAAFVNAATAMAGVSSLDTSNSGVLCCTGSVKDRYLELAAMLATFAQETTGGAADPRTGLCIPPCTGGLYFRYENPSLLGNCVDWRDCVNWQTTYYTAPGKTEFYVSASQTGGDITTQQTYTPNLWKADPHKLPSDLGVTTYANNTTPMTISYAYNQTVNESIKDTTGKEAGVALMDPSVLYPGLWVGDGPTQLTAESMYFFYGWYEKVFNNSTTYSNYYAFVQDYLQDGKLAFVGAYWYWMYRINGKDFVRNINYYTIHQMMTNTNSAQQVCHGIAAATAFVNGGCNNFSGRKSFYDYFATIVNPDPGGPNDILVPYTYTTGGISYSSTDCSGDIYNYCKQPA